MTDLDNPQELQLRCQMYLLGALSAEQTQAFESQMDQSASVRNALAQQAEFLALLGDARRETDALDSDALDSDALDSDALDSELLVSVGSKSALGQRASNGRFRSFTVLAAIAAMVLFMLAWHQHSKQTIGNVASKVAPSIASEAFEKAERIDKFDDGQQLAQAWAINRTQLNAPWTEPNFDGGGVESAAEPILEIPSWLAVGVAQVLGDGRATLPPEENST